MKAENSRSVMRHLLIVSALLTTTLIAGCAGSSQGTMVATPAPTSVEDVSVVAASAAMVPIGEATPVGTVDLRFHGDDVRAIANLEGIPTGSHDIEITSEQSCPAAADRNDAVENPTGLNADLGQVEADATGSVNQKWRVPELNSGRLDEVIDHSLIVRAEEPLSSAGSAGMEGEILACGIVRTVEM